MPARDRNLWAVILAGGSGTRLTSLTRALYGEDLPKQYAVLAGEDSLLQAAVARAVEVASPSRTLVVVTAPHGDLARRQLARWPEVEVVVQPHGLDTGPGLLLPLAMIHARDPFARVFVQPADHHYARPERLLQAVDRAEAVTLLRPDVVTLLGVAADAPDTEYGWILPGREVRLFGAREIEAFVEKPDAATARALLAQGAMWNAFVLVAGVRRLLALAGRQMPRHAARFAAMLSRGDRPSPSALVDAFAALPPVNFSRAVLETAPGLAVVPLEGSGWSDFGTPRRVFASLQGTADHDRLIARLRGSHDLPLTAVA